MAYSIQALSTLFLFCELFIFYASSSVTVCSYLYDMEGVESNFLHQQK